jgi:DNA-binding response OmpR family regulator
MTANSMDDDRQKCLDAGMDDYVSKPVLLPTLSAALKKASSCTIPSATHDQQEKNSEDSKTKQTELRNINTDVLSQFLAPEGSSKPSVLPKISSNVLRQGNPQTLERNEGRD